MSSIMSYQEVKEPIYISFVVNSQCNWSIKMSTFRTRHEQMAHNPFNDLTISPNGANFHFLTRVSR